MERTKSLSFQIWIWFAIGIVIMGVVISGFVFISFEQYYKEEIYRELGIQQQQIIKWADAPESIIVYDEIVEGQPILEDLTVDHVIKERKDLIAMQEFDTQAIELESVSPFITMPSAEFTDQTMNYEKGDTFFVISEEVVGEDNFFIYSYVTDNLRARILRNFSFVFIAIAFLILLMLAPAKLIANRITRPLVGLEGELDKISNRDWSQPIQVEGAKELVSLARSSEAMRQQLIKYENQQQELLQNISHELKTPIMVIRSYIQAKQDGLYAAESEQTMYETIDQEAIRMQRIVAGLIQLANIDYVLENQKAMETKTVYLNEIIEETCRRVKFKRPEIKIEILLEEKIIKGDPEHWKVIFENLIQNAVRHAKHEVKINLNSHGNKTLCEIYNDGNSINEEDKSTIFKAFYKGKSGETGLGLAIVKRMLDLYHGEICFKNQNVGVSFYIEL